jgi:glycosyltransferase involved in cell wall biosynthesis
MATTRAPSEPSVQPILSVIIPTYHRERQVAEAIQSVLDTGFAPLEIIVMDDSPEGSARDAVLAFEHPSVLYRQMPEPSRGRPALVRNHAIELARGEFLYCLDDDDRVHPGGLRALVDALQKHPRKGVAFGEVTCFGPDEDIRRGYERWFRWAARIARQFSFSSWLTAGIIMFRGTLIINSTCMIRRTAAQRLGGYDPTIAVYEDVEFFTRGIRQFGHVFVPEPVLQYGTGQSSIMHDLNWEIAVISEAHRRIHAAYKRNHGILEYRMLQVTSKLLPIPDGPGTTPAERESTASATTGQRA